MAQDSPEEVVIEEIVVVVEEEVPDEHQRHHRRKLTYFVNGEPFVTERHQRTVRAILTGAAFDPVEQYKLERDSDHHVFEDYDKEVQLREDERFTATYVGPTPTS
ncbi:MAG TPA: hypothetical protein VHW74_13270 [Mycobacteriales bacterium]|jgi:hypothetical protein|nr:hypothetical protein [Mycobacteriales bacterium]